MGIEIDERYFERLAEIQLKGFRNLDLKNDPILIAIAGPMSSGKSTLAKKLGDALNAVRISTDEARFYYEQLLGSKNPGVNVNKYMFFLLQKLLNYDNKRLLLDASVDRVYSHVLSYAEKMNARVFLISVDTNPEVLLMRLRKRNESNEEGWDKVIAEEAFWVSVEEHKEFLRNYTPNISLTDTSEADIERVISTFNHFIAQS